MGKKKNFVMDASQDENLDLNFENQFDNLESSEPETPTIKQKVSTKKSKTHSKKYQSLKKDLDKTKKYKVEEVISTVLAISKEKFDASIELHLQMKKDKLSGNIELPHSSGKAKKVVIFTPELETDIKNQKIDFDVLIATPQDMPKLAKYARFLGPKGLMPNPKNGTVASNPQQALKNFSANKIAYKTEKKAPLIHLTIGKKSLGQNKLTENLQAILSAINPKQIKKAHLSSSMSPSIALDLN